MAINTPVLGFPNASATSVPVSITFSWSSITGNTQYQLQLDTLNTFQSPVRDLVTTAVTQKVKDLRFGKLYYWRVRAIQNTDTSAWTTVRNFTTFNTITFTSPANNTTNVNALIDMTYRRLGTATLIQIDTAAGFNSPVRIDTLINDTVYATTINATLSFRPYYFYFGKKYYVRAMAFNAADTLTVAQVLTFTTRPYSPVTSPTPNSTYDVALAPSSTLVTSLADGNIIYQYQLDTSYLFNSPLLALYQRSYTSTPPAVLLHYGKKYYVRARAMHPADTSPWSPSVPFNTLAATSLQAPSLIAPDTFISPDSVYFRTVIQSSVNRYEYKLDTTPAFNSPLLRQDTMMHYLNSGRVWFKNLLFNQRYYFAVRLITDVDTSDWFIKGYSTSPSIRLLAPENFATYTLSNPLLDWAGTPQARKYQLQLGLDPDLLARVTDTITADTVSKFTTPDLLFNQVYYWRVRVVLSNGDTSGWSETRRFSTSPYAIYINNPLNDETNVSINPTYISWDQPAGIRGYHYRISEDSLFLNGVIERYINSATASSDNVMGLSYGTKYFLQVRGYNKVDTSDWYYLRRFFTRPLDPVPGKPTLISPANGATKQPYDQLPLKWSAASNATTYDIQTDLTPAFASPVSGNTGNTQINLTTLISNTTYYWRVRGKNATQTGPWSDAFSFTTLPQLLPPTGLTPDNFAVMAAASVHLQWTGDPSVENYQYQFANDPFFSGALTNTTTQESADISNLQYGLTYYWRVRAVIAPYASSWSDYAIFRTGLVGIDEAVAAQGTSWIYPNPAKDRLYIDQQQLDHISRIGLYNLGGQLLREEAVSTQHAGYIDLQGLQPGMYLVRIETTEGCSTHKLVIE